ncbi:M24 family metallopeptidase [Pelagibacteraceae bacterium]|nr:M24 family metallopeptidase [Pelagibacteraceae bacterium]
MIFEKEEYKERLKKVKIDMQKKGIDLLVSHDPANMNYLTGYDAWSFYYAQCVLVHINEDEPICFVRSQDGGGAYIKTYLQDKNIIEYDEKYIHTWPLHPYQYLVEIIKKKKWDNLNIGLEMDSHYFTAFCYETIKKGLPNAKLKDAERLVNWVRVVKSNAEIKLMQSAARIVESGMKTAFKSISPGVRQCDAVADIQKALFNGTKEFGGDYPSIATLLPTGKGTSAAHLTHTDEKFVSGEATIIEIAGVYKRYHCPMARTVLLGEKDQKKIDTMKATNEALNAGIEATKPGNTVDDVAQKFWGVLDKYKIKKDSRTGYSIGIGYPPDWGEQTFNILKGDKAILQPNVTFHMIAVMQFGDWGVEASEAVRVTETGSELFCNLSRELHIKE